MGVSLKAEVLPGSAISSASVLALGETTSTYGIAEACALSRSLASALTRERSPEAIAKVAHAAKIAIITIDRLLNARRGLFGTGAVRTGSVATSISFVSLVDMVIAFRYRLCLMLNHSWTPPTHHSTLRP